MSLSEDCLDLGLPAVDLTLDSIEQWSAIRPVHNGPAATPDPVTLYVLTEKVRK
jgi:hypothetical protein